MGHCQWHIQTELVVAFYPDSYTLGAESFRGGGAEAKRPGRSVDTHPHLGPSLKKE